MRRGMVVVLAAAVIGPVLGAQTVTGRLGGELTGVRYGLVDVPVILDLTGAPGVLLGSYTGRLSWNPATLVATCVTSGEEVTVSCDTLLRPNFPSPLLNTDSLSEGILRFTAVSPVGVPGLVTVGHFVFALEDTTATPVNLSFSEVSAAATFTNLLPDLTVMSPTDVCSARGRWGDLDHNGVSDSRDALLTLSSVVGLPVDTIVDTVGTSPLVVDTSYNDASLGDVDGDGSVTSKDALIILSHTVGIPVPGTRILLLASPSACASGSAHTLAVLPPDPVLVPGQPLKLIPQAQDTAGRVVAADSVRWTSSNATVAGVDPTGVVTARAAGTAMITAALGPGVLAVDTLTVVGQRYNWYVSAAQTGAPIQVGNSTYPFDNPSKVFAYVSEGDTVRVASGVYNDTSNANAVVNAGVVILGGTPGDTTTRPLIADAYINSNTALILQGGNNTVIRNVAFKNFYETIELDGVRSFELIGSKITAPSGFDNYGIYACPSAPQSMDSIRVDTSAFVGDSASPAGDALYYGSCGGTVVHTLVRNAVFKYWNAGLVVYDADSMDVLQSQFSGSSEGINALGTTGIYPAIHISHTHFAGVSFAAEMDEARRFALDSSSIVGAQGPEIGGGDGPVPLTETYLQGDTITPPAQGGWIFASAVDTLGVDQTIVQWPDSVASPFSELNVVYPEITRSQFLNVSNGEGFYFSGLTQALVDSVVMVGCNVAGCDEGYGFEFLSSGTGSLNTTVVGSRFDEIAYPIYASATSGTQIVSGTVIDSAALPMQLAGDSAIVTHDSLSRVTNVAVSITTASTRGASLIAHDSVLCSASAEADGLLLTQARAYAVDSNLVSGCLEGVDLVGTAGSAVIGNTLRGPGSYGLIISEQDTALVPIDSNGVSGFGGEVGYGIDVTSGHVYLRGNNVENNGYGLYVTASTPPDSAVGNAFVGNTSYQVYSINDAIYAVNDWWGAVTGPVLTQLVGPVVYTPFLLSLPGLPSLAPPAGPLATRVSLAPTAVTLATGRTTPVPTIRTTPEPPLAGLSPARAAQITAQRARRSMEVSRETARRAAQSSAAAATSGAIATERLRRSVARR